MQDVADKYPELEQGTIKEVVDGAIPMAMVKGAKALAGDTGTRECG